MGIKNTAIVRFRGLLFTGFVVLFTAVAHGQVFVANTEVGTIGEYDLDGTQVNDDLITVGSQDFASPWGITISGTDIFVANAGAGTIGEYTTAGDTVNASLITGLSQPYNVAISGSCLFIACGGYGNYGGSVEAFSTSGVQINNALVPGSAGYSCGIAVSGTDLFVDNYTAGTIGEYSTSGDVLNPLLVTGLSEPEGLAVSGTDLYVANVETGEIGEYTTSGTTVTTSLFPGLHTNGMIAVSGSDLLICYSDENYSTIGAYTLSGDAIDPTFITDLPLGNYPLDLAVVGAISTQSVPEPSTWVTVIVGLGALLSFRRRR